MTKERLILALPADMHSGNALALAPDKFINSFGNEIGANEFQVQLKAHWDETWDKLAAFTKEAPSRVIVVHVGDATDGVNNLNRELISMVGNEQVTIHTNLMKGALAKFAKKPELYYVRGTAYHAGMNSEYEEAIASNLKAVPYIEQKTEHDVGSFTHPYLVKRTACGKIDIAHHGGTPGTRAWLKGNELLWRLKSTYFTALEHKVEPPRWVFRAHKHNKAYAHFKSDTGTDIEARLLPCWMMKNSYAMKVADTSLTDIGMTALVVEPDGRSWLWENIATIIPYNDDVGDF